MTSIMTLKGAMFGAFGLALLLVCSSGVNAQTATIFSSKAHSPTTVDQNGVDLSSGQFVPPTSARGIGNASSGLSESVGGTDFPNGSRYVGGITVMDPYENKVWAKSKYRNCYTAFVYFGEYRKLFYYVFPETGLYGGHFVASDGSADILDDNGAAFNYLCRGPMTLTTSDGTVVEFNGTMATDFGVDAKHGVITKITKPDGEVIDIGIATTEVATGVEDPDLYEGMPPEWAVESYAYYVGSSLGWVMEGASVFSSTGYNFHNWGQVRPGINSIGAWSTIQDLGEAQIQNLTNGRRTQKQRWTKVQYIGDITYDFKVRQRVEERKSDDCYINNTQDASFADDLRNRSNLASDYMYYDVSVSTCYMRWNYTHVEKVEVIDNLGVVTTVDYYLPPDDFSQPSTVYGGCHSPMGTAKTCVKSVTKGGSVWKYTWSAGSQGNIGTTSVDIEDPQGRHRYVTLIADGTYYRLYGAQVLRDQDELGRVTTYEYDQDYPGRLTKVTHPEGNYEQYIYNQRGNLTEYRVYPKGGGSPIVQLAGYDATCANLKTCNKPNWTEDAKGNRTNYEYYAEHGGVKTVTGPADGNVIPPKTTYEYSQLYPRVLNNIEELENSTPVWRLTKESTCSTATTCPGSVNETVTEYAYANNNLLMTSKTVRSGNNAVSATISYGYDFGGNVIWTDGPRTDVDDKSYTVYDFYRHPVLEIGPDPDGGGPLKRQYIKHYYDRDFRETKTETGTCSDVTISSNVPTGCTSMVIVNYTEKTFDPVTGLPVKTIVAKP